MQTQEFTVVQGSAYQIALPFIAKSVLIDNPGAQWVSLPDADAIVPPYTLSAVALLRTPAQVARIASTPPTGFKQLTGGQQATVIFTEATLAPTPGVAMPGLVPAAQLTEWLPFNATSAGASNTLLASFPALQAGIYETLQITASVISTDGVAHVPYLGQASFSGAFACCDVFGAVTNQPPHVVNQQTAPFRVQTDGSEIPTFVATTLSGVWTAGAYVAVCSFQLRIITLF